MTGIVTAASIALIRLGSLIRATPPSLRMSAGTRSNAITAQAPASCASRACSGVTTSMMTPPFNISARPALTLKVPFWEPLPFRSAMTLLNSTLGSLRSLYAHAPGFPGGVGGAADRLSAQRRAAAAGHTAGLDLSPGSRGAQGRHAGAGGLGGARHPEPADGPHRKRPPRRGAPVCAALESRSQADVLPGPGRPRSQPGERRHQGRRGWDDDDYRPAFETRAGVERRPALDRRRRDLHLADDLRRRPAGGDRRLGPHRGYGQTVRNRGGLAVRPPRRRRLRPAGRDCERPRPGLPPARAPGQAPAAQRADRAAPFLLGPRPLFPRARRGLRPFRLQERREGSAPDSLRQPPLSPRPGPRPL